MGGSVHLFGTEEGAVKTALKQFVIRGYCDGWMPLFVARGLIIVFHLQEA